MAAVPVFVNARFLPEAVTGVQRYAREVLACFDDMLAEGEIDAGRFRVVLLTPQPPATDPGWRHLELKVAGRLRSHAWEQWSLPRLARGPLLNLKNTAPVRHPRQALVVHDLQVFARPETHTRTFNALYRWVMPRAARRARVCFAPSQSTAAEMEKYLGVAAKQVVVTSEGHEHALRTPAETSVLERYGIPRGRYLLAAGSLNPNKNFAAVLRAVQAAGIRGLPLVIVGGTDPRVFAGPSDPAALPAGAIHLGRVSDGELRALYEHALAFVYPSFYEGFGLPPLEAMALGCPVVCSDTTSLPEVGGDAVLYCDPADVEGLARQITRLHADTALRQDLSRRGRVRAHEFRWRTCARRIWERLAPLAGE